jgi:hypothetical protein
MLLHQVGIDIQQTLLLVWPRKLLLHPLAPYCAQL